MLICMLRRVLGNGLLLGYIVTLGYCVKLLGIRYCARLLGCYNARYYISWYAA